MLEQFFALWQPLLVAYKYLAMTAFIWAPILLAWAFWSLWIGYVQARYIGEKFNFILLEIKLPKEIFKSPAAMEIVLETMYQVSGGTWYEAYWQGRVVPWFSLEMISIEGTIHFFIRTPAKFRRIIEAAIYGQYPGVEVVEVPDYVFAVPYDPKKKDWSVWGTEYELTKPDPYPIKTYVDYKLNDTQAKEEQKIDPMLTILEFLGTVGRGQQLWFQIMIQATRERYHVPGTYWQKRGWKDEGKELLKSLREKTKGEDGVKLSKREEEVLYAIERSIGKLGFDVGIRGLYVSKNESFDPSNISGFFDVFRHFNSNDLNGFKHTNTTSFDFPWQDYKDIRVNKKKKEMFEAYIRRSYFYAPYKGKPFVLNTEELATVFHFPGGVAETPTFGRIESKKSEPPANLPI